MRFVSGFTVVGCSLPPLPHISSQIPRLGIKLSEWARNSFQKDIVWDKSCGQDKGKVPHIPFWPCLQILRTITCQGKMQFPTHHSIPWNCIKLNTVTAHTRLACYSQFQMTQTVTNSPLPADGFSFS